MESGWLALIYLLAAGIAIVVGMVVGRLKTARGKQTFIILIGMLSFWLVAQALRLFFPPHQGQLFWIQAIHSVVALMSPLWLILILQYQRKSWLLASPNLLLLYIEPILTVLLVWTNPLHHLYWRSVSLSSNEGLVFVRGPLFWTHLGYVYLVLFVSILMLVRSFSKVSRLYRMQGMALLLGLVFPWFANLIYLFGVLPFQDVDLTPLGLALTTPLLAWALFQSHLRELIPVAHDAVIESIRAGVIVLDADNIIVAANQAALRGLRRKRQEVIGQPGQRVFAQWPELIEQYRGKTEVRAEVILEQGKRTRYNDLRISPLYDPRGHLNGVVMVIHDVTDYKRAKLALEESEQRYRSLFDDSANAIFIETLDGIIIDCNVMASKLFGYTKDELRQMHISQLVPPGANPILPRPDQKELQTYSVDVYNRHKDGRLIPIELRTRIISLNGAKYVIAYVQDITERKQAEAALRANLAETEALYRISQTLNSAADLNDRLQEAVQITAQALHADHLLIIVFDTGRYRHDRVFSSHAQGVFAEASERLTLDQWPIQQMLKEKKLLRLDSKQLEQLLPDHFEGTEQALLAPLLVHDRVLGLMCAARFQDRSTFSPHEEGLIQTVAGQAGVAIENSRLLDAERQQRLRAEILREVTGILTRSLDRQQVLNLILEQLEYLVEYDSASIMLLQDGLLSIVAQRKFRSEQQNFTAFAPHNFPHIQEVLEACHPLILQDTYRDPRWKITAGSEYIHCWLGVPLIGRSQVIGLLNLDKAETSYYNQEDVALTVTLANHAAIAIENARLYQEARDSSERRMVLHHATQEIVAARLDPEGIYTAIHQAASKLMPTEAFVITLLSERGDSILPVYLMDRGQRDWAEPFPIDKGISGKVLSLGHSIRIMDFANQLSSFNIDRVAFGRDEDFISSMVAVPMKLGGKVIGVLSAQSYTAHAYLDEDEYLLEMLASYAANALENARLFGEVQRLAITDPLTEIYNRRHLFDLGQREFARAWRFDRPLAAIMIDIDHFKQVNDTYGHATGDRVLEALAHTLQSNLREVDILGRYGGEEFTILLPETEAQAAQEAAERLRQQIANLQVASEQGLVQVTISAGIAVRQLSTRDLADLIDQADKALYRAKHAGRNRIAHY